MNLMNFLLPNPLHPAVVHFPIALILVGSAGSLVAMIWSKGRIPLFAAALLVLGAMGAGGAYLAGEKASDQAGKFTGERERLLERHAEWGERTLTVSIIAAVFSVAAVVAGRWPKLGAGSRVAAFLVAAAAAACVAQTARLGGRMVYEHGIGVGKIAASPAPVSPESGELK